MAVEAGRRAALVILRAWLEDDGETALRIRITHVVGDRMEVSHAASVEDVQRIVGEALTGLLASKESSDRPVTPG